MQTLNAIDFGLGLGLLALAMGILRACRFQPWNIEFCILTTARRLPWYVVRALAYFCGLIILAPAALFFWLALQMQFEAVFRRVCFGLLLVRLYAQFVLGCNLIYTKYANEALLFVAEVVRETLFWIIQILLSGCFADFDHVAFGAAFLAVDFMFITRSAYASSERGTINIVAFYRQCIEFLSAKVAKRSEGSKQPTPKPETAEIARGQFEPRPKREFSQEDSAQDLGDDSIPNEYSPQQLPTTQPPPRMQTQAAPENIAAPPIPMDNVISAEPSPPEAKAENLKRVTATFAEICVGRIVEYGAERKAELKTIVDAVAQAGEKGRMIRVAIYILLHYGTLCVYAVAHWAKGVGDDAHVGLCNAIFIIVYDCIVYLWWKSDLHSQPVSHRSACFPLLLIRISSAAGAHYIYVTHLIPLLALGVLLCNSIRNYYIPLNSGKKPEDKDSSQSSHQEAPTRCPRFFRKLFAVASRFEVQLLLLAITEAVFQYIHFWYYSRTDVQFVVFVTLLLSTTYLPLSIWERLYRLENHRLTPRLVALILGVFVGNFLVNMTLMLATVYSCSLELLLVLSLSPIFASAFIIVFSTVTAFHIE